VLVPDNALSWPEVAARLTAARTYWLCTTTPSGAPHAVPVWGVRGTAKDLGTPAQVPDVVAALPANTASRRLPGNEALTEFKHSAA